MFSTEKYSISLKNYSNSTIFCLVFNDLESGAPASSTFNKYQYLRLKSVLNV